jgi:hypothetical protein
MHDLPKISVLSLNPDQLNYYIHLARGHGVTSEKLSGRTDPLGAKYWIGDAVNPRTFGERPLYGIHDLDTSDVIISGELDIEQLHGEDGCPTTYQMTVICQDTTVSWEGSDFKDMLRRAFVMYKFGSEVIDA